MKKVPESVEGQILLLLPALILSPTAHTHICLMVSHLAKVSENFHFQNSQLIVDEILAVGSSTNVKVETLDDTVGSWVVAEEDYGVITGFDRIYGISIVFINDAFYVFGGTGRIPSSGQYSVTNLIGRFNIVTREWSVAGNTVGFHSQANTIFDGSSVLVIGGEGLSKTDACQLDETGFSFTCIEQEPTLEHYIFPALFFVPVDFCNI